ncbi:Glycine cleavage H-protein [mine drainage metagenome]|uniref:Glycine cleavage H-protein n=1 Tax=mine drainage metagenome TaxID=410659 RepID=T1CGF3_9ZZZZ
MSTVRGCSFPDDLFYDVANNMWYREEADGSVVTGMTQVAVAMAGQLVAVTPKKAGKEVQAGKSCATIESGKWVGPAKIAFDAEVTAINDALVAARKWPTPIRTRPAGCCASSQPHGPPPRPRWCRARKWPHPTKPRWPATVSLAAAERLALPARATGFRARRVNPDHHEQRPRPCPGRGRCLVRVVSERDPDVAVQGVVVVRIASRAVVIAGRAVEQRVIDVLQAQAQIDPGLVS